MERIIIYHNNCYDGITAAYVCWKHFKSDDTIQYVPMNYGDKPPDVRGANVVMVDFSLKREPMKELIKASNSMIVLDHHKTAEAELNGILEEVKHDGHNRGYDKIVFDMNRSGAGLAWDFFNNNKTRPILVDYIEDRDLWRYKLPNSREINAFYQSFDIDLKTWIKEVGPHENDPSVVKEGKSLLRLQGKLVRQIADNARLQALPMALGDRLTGDYNYLLIAPHVSTSVLMSEVCEEMLERFKDHQWVYYSFRRKDGKVQFGLRSRSGFDVSAIAKSYGGGGHAQAAGFELRME